MATITGTEFNDNNTFQYINGLFIYRASLNGTAQNDHISGLAGNDILNGNNGNDTLNGGTDADTMSGGNGNDNYYVDHVDDVVIEYVGQGIDTIYSSISYTLGNGLSDHIENLSLTGSAYGGWGNDLNNIISGSSSSNYLSGGAGNDTLYGNGGNDTISGGIGNDNLNGGIGEDEMYGGTGNDNYYVDNVEDVVTEYFGQGTDTVHSSATSYVLSANVENLTLTALAGDGHGEGNSSSNVISGNSFANTLYGYAGNDTLYGNNGNDILYGGFGNDNLNGGLGEDTMYGGTGNDNHYVDHDEDLVVEYFNEGTDTVYSSIQSYGLNFNVERLTLIGSAENGYGNNLNNVISGNAANNNLSGNGGHDTLNGGSGNDNISGGFGNDVLDGGSGNDSMYGGDGNDRYYVNSGDVVIEYAFHGTDTVNSYIDYILGDNVENLTLIGFANNGEGNNLNNIISGNNLDNDLYGNDGNDTLIGGGGNDYLNGFGSGQEFDMLTGGTGADTFAVGTNYVQYYGSGYATITDFSRIEGDEIQLAGAAGLYSLGSANWGGSSAMDTGIYYNGDLIGVVRDTTTVSIQQDFTFVDVVG